MKNKIFATIVIIMMAIQALPLHILADFQVHWAEGSIELLQESNIVLGDENGNINLDNFITRAEFTAIVNRTFEFNETSDNNFIDVSPNSWYYRDFSIAKNLGFIMGDENGMANPESNIRRVEVALILARVLGLESEQLPNFTDNNEIPSWGIFAVSAMQENGLISGYQDGSFRSLSDITRAEAFTIIANIIRSREEAIEIVSTTSNFANVNTSSNNAGNSNDNSDNSQDGETTPPINSPAPPNLPPSGGNNPIIIVHTEFPSGEVTQSYIDIEYTATPSQGAVITEIFYRTNDGAEDFIYLSEASGFTPMGELGRARVFIRPDENNIVFTVRDSAGREGHFTVEATPTLSWFVEYEEDPRVIKADPEGYEFVANNLSIMVHEGVTREQVEEVIANINGRIVWMSVISNNYDINLPPHEYEDLRAIIEYLETEFSDVIRHVSINWLAFLDNQPTNDPWWNDRRFPFRSSQWGLSAIRVPEAWDFLQTQETRDVRIGIVDGGIRYTHEDLQIPSRNVVNSTILEHRDHGTHVMGIIGAIHNNDLGLSGVVNISRSNLFSYDAFRGSTLDLTQIRRGFEWNIIQGAKIINISAGARHSRLDFLEAMELYLNRGYDFIVVQSAGHTVSNANDSRIFQTQNLPETDQRRQRVLTVSATNRRGNLMSESNFGLIIDILAPGVDIYSTGDEYDDHYFFDSGTSMAAPHVAGVAALVWSANRGFTGAQVRDIVRVSGGLIVFDERSSVPENHRRAYHQIDAFSAVQIARNVNPERTTGQLTGKILQVGANILDQGIENARITIRSNMYFPETTVEFFAEEFSDEYGYFFIQNIPAGAYSLEIAANGFATMRTTVFVEVGATSRIEELLEPAPIVIDGSFRIEFEVSNLQSATMGIWSNSDPNPNINAMQGSNTTFFVNSLSDGEFSFSLTFDTGRQSVLPPNWTPDDFTEFYVHLRIFTAENELVTTISQLVTWATPYYTWDWLPLDIEATNEIYTITPTGRPVTETPM